MQKIYSLLRNNKQSGPYTLEELLQFNLKPFDLVWVEGESGGWSYPTEIGTLKIYVAEIPKPAEKKEISSIPQTTELISSPGISLDNFETEPKKTTTTIPKAKHVYISLPAGTQISKPEPAQYVSAEMEESPEAKLERKATELRNKIQAFAQNKNLPKKEDDLDIKYTRSLDDIKEEYSSWLHQQQKKKTVLSKKTGLIAVSILILIVAGYFIIPQVLSPKKDTAYILSAEEITASKPTFIQPDKIEEAPLKPPNRKNSVKVSKKTNSKTIAYPTSKINSSKKESDKVDGYIDSLKRIENNNTTKQVEEVTYEAPSVTQNGSRQSTKRQTETATKAPATKNETGSTFFTELIKLSESTGSVTPHLSLYNNSNRHLNFVAIDVYYYNANQKLLQKKTLYFNDITAGSSAKLFVPKEKNAASVRYQMGLISTDSGLYYAKH